MLTKLRLVATAHMGRMCHIHSMEANTSIAAPSSTYQIICNCISHNQLVVLEYSNRTILQLPCSNRLPINRVLCCSTSTSSPCVWARARRWRSNSSSTAVIVVAAHPRRRWRWHCSDISAAPLVLR